MPRSAHDYRFNLCMSDPELALTYRQSPSFRSTNAAPMWVCRILLNVSDFGPGRLLSGIFGDGCVLWQLRFPAISLLAVC